MFGEITVEVPVCIAIYQALGLRLPGPELENRVRQSSPFQRDKQITCLDVSRIRGDCIKRCRGSPQRITPPQDCAMS